MSITQKNNIFIYGVCGRSSSTALQRIINSSNEVLMFGEHDLILEKLIDCYFSMFEIDHEVHQKEWSKLIECFETKKHVSFYANATKDLRNTQEELKALIINLLTPPFEDRTLRIGYKEISTTRLSSLLNVEKFFPESSFVFLFRNPLEQWGSVGFLKSFWTYSKNLDDFLREYERLATIYLYASVKRAFFIDSQSLYDREKITKFLEKLEIDNFDQSLVGQVISTTNKHQMSIYEKMRILSSKAFKLYQKMKEKELESIS